MSAIRPTRPIAAAITLTVITVPSQSKRKKPVEINNHGVRRIRFINLLVFTVKGNIKFHRGIIAYIITKNLAIGSSWPQKVAQDVYYVIDLELDTEVLTLDISTIVAQVNWLNPDGCGP